MRTSHQLRVYIAHSDDGDIDYAISTSKGGDGLKLPTELPAQGADDVDECRGGGHSFFNLVNNVTVKSSNMLSLLAFKLSMAVVDAVRLLVLWILSPLQQCGNNTSIFSTVADVPVLLCQLALVYCLVGVFGQFLPSWSTSVAAELSENWVGKFRMSLRGLILALCGGAANTLCLRVVAQRRRSLLAVATVSQVVKKVRYIGLGHQCYQPQPAIGSLGAHLRSVAGADATLDDQLVYGTRQVTLTVVDDLFALCLSIRRNRYLSIGEAADLSFEQFQVEVVSAMMTGGQGRGHNSCPRFDLWAAAEYVLRDSIDACLQECLRPLCDFDPARFTSAPGENPVLVWLVKAMGGAPVKEDAPAMVRYSFLATQQLLELCVIVCECFVNVTVLICLCAKVLSLALHLYWALSFFISRCAAISPAVADSLDCEVTDSAGVVEGKRYPVEQPVAGPALRQYRRLRHELARAKMDHEAAWRRYQALEHKLCSQTLHRIVDRGSVADDPRVAQELVDIVDDLILFLSAQGTSVAVDQQQGELKALIVDLQEVLLRADGACTEPSVGVATGVDIHSTSDGGEMESVASIGSTSLSVGAQIDETSMREYCSTLEPEDSSSSGVEGVNIGPQGVRSDPVLDIYTATTAPDSMDEAEASFRASMDPSGSGGAVRVGAHRVMLAELGLAIHSRNPLAATPADGSAAPLATGSVAAVRVYRLGQGEGRVEDEDQYSSGGSFVVGEASDERGVECGHCQEAGAEGGGSLASERRQAQAISLSHILNASVGASARATQQSCYVIGGDSSDSEDEVK